MQLDIKHPPPSQYNDCMVPHAVRKEHFGRTRKHRNRMGGNNRSAQVTHLLLADCLGGEGMDVQVVTVGQATRGDCLGPPRKRWRSKRITSAVVGMIWKILGVTHIVGSPTPCDMCTCVRYS